MRCNDSDFGVNSDSDSFNNHDSTASGGFSKSLAKELLQEMEWEDKWDATLESSQSALDKLTLRAMKKYREGKTVEKGFDEL